VLIAGGGGGDGAGAAAPGASLGGTAGLAWIYALNALSFAAVLFVLATLQTTGKVEAPEGGHAEPLQALRQGLRFVFRTPLMVWTMALDFVATFFSGSMSLLPIFADQALGLGARGYGLLAGAPALGALAGSLYTSSRPLPRRQGSVFLWAVAAYGAATIVFGFAEPRPDVRRARRRRAGRPRLDGHPSNAAAADHADALRGRMTSVNMIFFMGGPQLGELKPELVAKAVVIAGGATVLGATVSVVSGGAATILAAPRRPRLPARPALRLREHGVDSRRERGRRQRPLRRSSPRPPPPRSTLRHPPRRARGRPSGTPLGDSAFRRDGLRRDPSLRYNRAAPIRRSDARTR
jgi:hypothetical protein